MKRVSKNDWLQAAWNVLGDHGVEAMRVQRIAKELGISMSGFYCHFDNRDDLRNQMVDYWAQKTTG